MDYIINFYFLKANIDMNQEKIYYQRAEN